MTINQNQTKAESHSIPPEADHGKLAHLIAISLYDAIWPANLWSGACTVASHYSVWWAYDSIFLDSKEKASKNIIKIDLQNTCVACSEISS